MKTPRCKTGQINVESETEIGDETGRKETPKFSKVQGLKGTVFQDVGGVVELERSVKSVGVGGDPEKQDQEETGPRG